MLFHSAYSNSYVNLAIFRADVDRGRLAELVGGGTPGASRRGRDALHAARRRRRRHAPAPPPRSTHPPAAPAQVGPETEALIHTFCVVPRHQLVYEELLWKLTDDAQLDVAPSGITVKHIKTGGRGGAGRGAAGAGVLHRGAGGRAGLQAALWRPQRRAPGL